MNKSKKREASGLEKTLKKTVKASLLNYSQGVFDGYSQAAQEARERIDELENIINKIEEALHDRGR